MVSEARAMPVLPVAAYTSQAWFDREQARIFSRTWAFAGLAEDVTEPGQYIAAQAGLNNIFIVMGYDRRLRAFHNVCRHRGTQLLRPLGKAKKAIICPYHDWTYDMEGRLTGVPSRKTEFPDLDTACLALKPAAVDRWRGMLWVHPDAGAGSIMDWFSEVEPLLGPHRVDELVEHPKWRTSTDIAANWKIVVENYIDGYHLPHLHAGTLAMYDHAKIESGFVGPHFALWEPLAADYLDGIERKSALPLIDHVPRDRIGAWVPMLFPGIGLAANESSWAVFHVIPLGPALTRVVIRMKVANVSWWAYMRQSARARYWAPRTRGKFPGGAAEDPLASGDFMAEDVYACEQQQKSLRSPYFEHGPSSRRGEAGVRKHQALVRDWVEGTVSS